MAAYFTYVWGSPGNPAWPLTFASKASRTQAKKTLQEGDLVFTVGTLGEPTPSESRGRVLGMYQVSDLEVNTADYDLEAKPHHSGEYDSVKRFPFALHSLEVWVVGESADVFSKIVGSLTPTHHLRAQSTIVELDSVATESLLRLDRQEVPVAVPKTEFGRARIMHKNSKLAPKHKGSFTGAFTEHDIWYVYTLALVSSAKKSVAVKIGYSHDPQKRADSYNRSMATEVTGFHWEVYSQQPTSGEDAARDIEQAVLKFFAAKSLPSNGEVLTGIEPIAVAGRIGVEMRAKNAV